MITTTLFESPNYTVGVYGKEKEDWTTYLIRTKDKVCIFEREEQESYKDARKLAEEIINSLIIRNMA